MGLLPQENAKQTILAICSVAEVGCLNGTPHQTRPRRHLWHPHGDRMHINARGPHGWREANKHNLHVRVIPLHTHTHTHTQQQTAEFKFCPPPFHLTTDKYGDKKVACVRMHTHTHLNTITYSYYIVIAIVKYGNMLKLFLNKTKPVSIQ